jgi:hypothetical protein
MDGDAYRRWTVNPKIDATLSAQQVWMCSRKLLLPSSEQKKAYSVVNRSEFLRSVLKLPSAIYTNCNSQNFFFWQYVVQLVFMKQLKRILVILDDESYGMRHCCMVGVYRSWYTVAVYTAIYVTIKIKQTKVSVLIYCSCTTTLHVSILTDRHHTQSLNCKLMFTDIPEKFTSGSTKTGKHSPDCTESYPRRW